MKQRATLMQVLVVIAIGIGVAGALYEDYGIHWDEPVQARYGELVVDYFASGLSDDEAKSYLDTRYYGPWFEALAALAYGANERAKWRVRHLLVALTGVATLVAVALLGAQLAPPWGGAAAALALATLPRFFGHAFINSKDVPFACLFAWTVFALLRLVNRPSWPRAALLGAAIGLALGIRPGALPVLLLLTTVVLAAAAWRDSSPKTWLTSGAAVWAIGWLVMVAPWPWAHESPLVHPLLAVRAALAFPEEYGVLFAGRMQWSTELPRDYLMRFVWLTTPPIVLALAAAGLVAGIRRQLRAPLAPFALGLLALEIWIAAPLGGALLLRPNVYDGLRHVLFVLPALALLAGLGANEIVSAVPRARLRTAALAALAAALAAPVVSLWRLHPYQMTYFSAFAGGVGIAQERYETDYWLLGYREAAQWLNARIRERNESPTLLVAVDFRGLPGFDVFVDPRARVETIFEPVPHGGLPEGVDYYVSTTRLGLHRNFPEAPIVHRVGRDGATFAVIRARSQ